MAISTQPQLLTDADQIRLETTPRANTAQRVGQFLRNLVDTLYAALGTKVDVVAGKGLSTNDYTTTDKNQLATNTTALGNKVDVVAGKGLSTNDYTTVEKNQLVTTTNALGGKVDKAVGFSLTKNDFTDVLKTKLDGLNGLNATNIRVDENDAPSGTIAVGAGHQANDVWINANTGLIWQLNADRSLYVRKGTSLKGRPGNQWLVGYADDPLGNGFTTSATNKKWRAEYLAATDTETFSVAKATGLWVQFSNNLLMGAHNGTLVDMNIDVASATDFSGAWSITDFTNVSPGMTARIKRRSLNNTYVAVAGITATVTATNYNLVTTSVAHNLIGGDLVRFPGGIIRTVMGNPNGSTTSFIVDPALTAPLTAVAYDKLSTDTLVLPQSSVRLTLAGSGVVSTLGGNFLVNQYGVFLEGLINTLRFECVSVTGVGASASAEFDLYITNK